MDEAYRRKLEDYVMFLEVQGHKVHLPHRDTDQTVSFMKRSSNPILMS